jgi:hypothetical protein
VAIGAPWVGTPVHGSTAGTSVTLDFTGATVGEWCYAAVALADSQASTPTAPSGWTVVVQGSEGTTGAASSRLVLYRRKKQAGDTTQAFAWATSCKYESLPWSWPGLDPTTPDEGAAYASHTSTANFVTGSVTPTSTDRWIGMVAGARGTTSLETFTPDAAMTERSDSNHGGANPFVAVELADTNTAVTQAGHTYTAVCSVADGHGGTIALALIPATAATVSGSASLTATGTVTASGLQQVSATAAPTATGSLAATAVNTALAVAALAGAATFTAAGRQTALGQAALTAAGALTASGTQTSFAAAALAAAGALTATATSGPPGSIGVTHRPNTGVTTRPYAGTTARPNLGTTSRPVGG